MVVAGGAVAACLAPTGLQDMTNMELMGCISPTSTVDQILTCSRMNGQRRLHYHVIYAGTMDSCLGRFCTCLRQMRSGKWLNKSLVAAYMVPSESLDNNQRLEALTPSVLATGLQKPINGVPIPLLLEQPLFDLTQ
ncbi:hypothetical protein M413DRAFT_32967 [Hebeloma cylindrosporum]|uniref:Uncharacterized protein n=1 Tax=Hebeloma cylindrosporum TaxID=76867 RepID=A0A0C2XA14_HEBCY|nr:hypothetical protein M413DRAFT_32967 [Hebeloma cylindrosporum h7]